MNPKLDHPNGPQISANDPAALSAFLRNWSMRLGIYSLFAAMPAITPADVPEPRPVDPKEPDAGIPRRYARAIDRMRNTCTRPEFLRRQAEYRLPHQRHGFDAVVAALAGTDNCPGKTVPAGVYTAASPFIDSGDTTGANDTVESNSCFYFYYYYYSGTAGPDHIYSFTITARGSNPQIQVSTSSSTYNPLIYILNGQTGPHCPAGIHRYANNCIAASEATGNGGTETIGSEQLQFVPLNTPLYLFIDSFSASGPNSAGPYTVRMQDVTIAESAPPRTKFDFDGDGAADLAVRRPSSNVWYLQRSGEGFTAMTWGQPGDRTAPADYDGDGRTDVAIFRPSESRWYIAGSRAGFYTVNWGVDGDLPVPADYDGDGKSDVAIYRPSEGRWYVIGSQRGFIVRDFGTAEDRPQPGDYDGDGKADLVLRRPSNHVWYLMRSNLGFTATTWGVPGDLPVPADYDGDGRTDIAIYRPSGAVARWWIFGSTRNIYTVEFGGAPGEIPAPADYDGDGQADIAIFRPTERRWYMLSTVYGSTSFVFGDFEDIPVHNAFAY